ncbi:uncharacterized protein LOC106143307 [Amyelois transitella]|uniref:uncharacterized protein LOC106143307 n=1 Tax=Amyelois transitella TaxID=680683 RepID=UPI00298F46C7|nr:uncharacterized protein LOC106143307 [Amyelois transitella]
MSLLKLCITWLTFIILWCVVLSLATESRTKTLSRKKRYVTFPEGSSFSTAICMTVGLIGQPAPRNFPGTFVFALNWGVAYDLPNATDTIMYYHNKYRLKKPVAKRRNRRELYRKIETILDNMGYNGRECILKTLCETTQRIVPHGDNMMEEMFRTLFTLPMSKILTEEPVEHSIYDAAHRLGVLLESCDAFKCPLSLVDWAQGYYNAQAPMSYPGRHPLSMFSSNFF